MAVMPTPRETWTDERLDDLNQKVDNGFSEVRAEMRQFRTEVGTRFDAVDRRFDALDRRLEALDRRFEALDPRFGSVESRVDTKFDATQRLIVQVSAGLFGTTLIGFLGVIVAVLSTHS